MNFISILFSAIALIAAATSTPPGWNTDIFQNHSTIQFYTTNAEGEGHWSTVWVVVIDGAPYIRLGSQAASRINGNADAPYVKVRVGDLEFDHVMTQSVPDMADKVGAAMADKYWSDILVRYARHVLTVRLVPSPEPQHS